MDLSSSELDPLASLLSSDLHDLPPSLNRQTLSSLLQSISQTPAPQSSHAINKDPFVSLRRILKLANLAYTDHSLPTQSLIHRLITTQRRLRDLSSTIPDLSSNTLDLSSNTLDLSLHNRRSLDLDQCVMFLHRKAREYEVTLDRRRRRCTVLEARLSKVEISADLRDDLLGQMMHEMVDYDRHLDTINKRDISEVRAYRHPPRLMLLVLKPVAILLGHGCDLDSLRRMLSDYSLLTRLLSIRCEDVREEIFDAMREFVQDPEFHPDNMNRVSIFGHRLCLALGCLYRSLQTLMDYPGLHEVAKRNALASSMRKELEIHRMEIAMMEPLLQQTQDSLEDAFQCVINDTPLEFDFFAGSTHEAWISMIDHAISCGDQFRIHLHKRLEVHFSSALFLALYLYMGGLSRGDLGRGWVDATRARFHDANLPLDLQDLKALFARHHALCNLELADWSDLEKYAVFIRIFVAMIVDPVVFVRTDDDGDDSAGLKALFQAANLEYLEVESSVDVPEEDSLPHFDNYLIYMLRKYSPAVLSRIADQFLTSDSEARVQSQKFESPLGSIRRKQRGVRIFAILKERQFKESSDIPQSAPIIYFSGEISSLRDGCTEVQVEKSPNVPQSPYNQPTHETNHDYVRKMAQFQKLVDYAGADDFTTLTFRDVELCSLFKSLEG